MSKAIFSKSDRICAACAKLFNYENKISPKIGAPDLYEMENNQKGICKLTHIEKNLTASCTKWVGNLEL